ncbi:hypothetical protein AB0H00_09490 [Nocardia sp. NPDC023852]|uniref:hypothetical protein n=1 Tax=Nocardia sp. NPDC023852 TaxID=3154697 RepID=UPI0033F43052
MARSGRIVTIDGTEITDARSLAGQIGIAKAMHRYNLRRTITFHSRVRRARQFARSLPDVVAWMPKVQRLIGILWPRHVSGEMPTGRRYALMKHLGTPDCRERALLPNARRLAEGVDIPALDSVAFVDPHQAEIDIVQAVGGRSDGPTTKPSAQLPSQSLSTRTKTPPSP